MTTWEGGRAVAGLLHDVGTRLPGGRIALGGMTRPLVLAPARDRSRGPRRRAPAHPARR